MFSFIPKLRAQRNHDFDRRSPVAPTPNLRAKLAGAADTAWVLLARRHLIPPTSLGTRPHDCALTSLYWAAPWISQARILEAFDYCTQNWPYAGITNTEFAIALKYLKTPTRYSDDPQTLGSLLRRKPYRSVALLHGHFIPIVNAKIVGSDARRSWATDIEVYCHWTFHSRRFSPAAGPRHTS